MINSAYNEIYEIYELCNSEGMLNRKDLEYGRVQCTGRCSFITSLPKDWVQEIGIGRGSEIAFKVQHDSSLILVPSHGGKKRNCEV